ncbi:hypothetical protein PflCFBP13510_16405 [Pseudomonas fluorescens]|nr:hypothetical protein PflCFBP13510_16405 [Pseudomonas fluorescens]
MRFRLQEPTVGARPLTPLVGASLLAKNVQAPRYSKVLAVSLTFFASKLAPTGSPAKCPFHWQRAINTHLSWATLLPHLRVVSWVIQTACFPYKQLFLMMFS